MYGTIKLGITNHWGSKFSFVIPGNCHTSVQMNGRPVIGNFIFFRKIKVSRGLRYTFQIYMSVEKPVVQYSFVSRFRGEFCISGFRYIGVQRYKGR